MGPSAALSLLGDVFGWSYVALAVSAYDRALLGESELAEYLTTDVATAPDIHIRRSPVTVEDGAQLPVDFTAVDLRAS